VGFITKNELLQRMALNPMLIRLLQSSQRDKYFYYLKKLNHHFSEIGINLSDETLKICIVFTGNNAYSFVQKIYHEIAEDLKLKAISD
jgi:hypothetical protein